jgi:hypothetical protein
MAYTFSESALMRQYEVDTTDDDFRKNDQGVYFALTDKFGQSVRVIVRSGEREWMVKEAELGDDVYVLADIDDKKDVRFAGWIPFHELEEAEPVEGSSGKFFMIDDEHLLPLPDDFVFMFPCTELPCSSNALFDHWTRSWDCLSCDRLRYAFGESCAWGEFGGTDSSPSDVPVEIA